MSDTWSRRWAYWMGFLKGELVHPIQYPKMGLMKASTNAAFMQAMRPHMVDNHIIDVQDTSIAVPTKQWVKEILLPWWREYMKRTEMQYTRYWDCDNYAHAFWNAACLAYAKDPQHADTIAVGYVKAEGHVVNAMLVDDDQLIFIEPQAPKIIDAPTGIYWLQF